MKMYQMTAINSNGEQFQVRIGSFSNHKKALLNFALEIWSILDVGTIEFFTDEQDDLGVYLESPEGHTIGRVGISLHE